MGIFSFGKIKKNETGMILRFFLLTVVVFSPLFSLDHAMRLKMEAESKVALVVGNSEYSKSNYFDKLPNPTNDVREISRKLKSLGFAVIEGHNLSESELNRKLKMLYYKLSKSEKGVGLFYFAGHGVEFGGENYLIPSDISLDKRDGLPIFSTQLSPILSKMNATGKRLNIAIIDACRENPFVEQPSRGAKIGGLVNVQASGTFVAYSAESGKVANDGTGQLSPFAKALSENIETPQSIESLFKKVRVSVKRETDEEQIPTTYSSIDGEFYFKLPSEDDLKQVQIQQVQRQNDKPVSKKNRIYVSTTPSDAKVRILNIRPKYYNGIDLKTDKALLEVSKSGYKKYLKWHRNLGDEVVLSVELERKALKQVQRETPKNENTELDSVWIDNEQNLMWQKYKGKERINWNKATNYCKNLKLSGFSDWRLPTRTEAKNLLTEYYVEFDNYENWKKWFDKNKHKRNNNKFLNNKISQFLPIFIWTSTINKTYSSPSWIVDFYDGRDYWRSQTSDNFAVCVRDL
ncbi:hypothetical protein ThvES_00014730 [Thiovulum sp. ES]|nr:hypothetical protein ThvES_00014730 [Thiovulum sp. ES]